MNSNQFPKVHSDKPYQQRGDSQGMAPYSTATKILVSCDEDMDGSQAPVETTPDLV